MKKSEKIYILWLEEEGGLYKPVECSTAEEIMDILAGEAVNRNFYLTKDFHNTRVEDYL